MMDSAISTERSRSTTDGFLICRRAIQAWIKQRADEVAVKQILENGVSVGYTADLALCIVQSVRTTPDLAHCLSHNPNQTLHVQVINVVVICVSTHHSPHTVCWSQIMGDGFLSGFRKHMINVHLRILRNDTPVWNTFNGVVTLGIFDGEECYETLSRIFERFSSSLQTIQHNRLTLKLGACDVSMNVEFWLGGDQKFFSLIYGFRGDFSSELPLLPTCDCPKSELGNIGRQCVPRTLAQLRALSHDPLAVNSFPWTCSACNQEFRSAQELQSCNYSQSAKKSWQQKHMGVGFQQ